MYQSELPNMDKWIQVHMHICLYTRVCSPRCSFSLPQSESKVLMSLRCPARRMLSAWLVSISELQLGSKLSSQEISSSSMVAALTCNTSISDATGAQADSEGESKKATQGEIWPISFFTAINNHAVRCFNLVHKLLFYMVNTFHYDITLRAASLTYWLGHPEADI